jgi:hypothetical protein
MSSGDGSVPLVDLVRVRPRFLRSINLERDFYAPDPLEGYVLTPAAVSTLERLAAGVRQPAARAWSITGAYGTGKSAFALLAAKAFAPPLLSEANVIRGRVTGRCGRDCASRSRRCLSGWTWPKRKAFGRCW